MTIQTSPAAAPRAFALQTRAAKETSAPSDSVTFVTFARALPLLLCAMFAIFVAPAQAQIDPATQVRIDRILKSTPLIDGHNDVPWELRENHKSSVEGLAANSDKRPSPMMTDMARLRKGRVGGQFWSVYLPSGFTGERAIQATLEQVDIVKRMVRAYPQDLELAETANDVMRIHKSGKIASLIGAEGGHQIGNSMAALRAYRDAGVMYMTLTWNHNNDWADSGTDDPKHNGLTNFGRAVIGEMNRIGMIVDLSHVSENVMVQALDATTAPVMFSHSNVRALSDHPRNVPDRVLKLLPSNGGVVMVNAYPGHNDPEVIAQMARRAAEEARLSRVYPGQADRRKAALAEWDKANPRPASPITVMANHIDHVARVAGHDHVGIGADLDGVPFTNVGMEDVAGYPNLFAELIKRGWSDANLAKLAGGNILRVMRRAEAVSAAMKDVPPSMATVN
jgi:membrane dipeptidase